MNLARFPRRGYVKEPTPLEFLPAFSKALGDKIRLWIKRDDLLPGAGGGNKTRKLDFTIADALSKGADTIITCGAVQSNHCRLTLAWAVHEGLDCHLVLEERVPGSYNPLASGNNFLYQLLGVKSITVVPGGSNMMEEMEKVAAKLREKGRKPYIVPGGASNAVGALGYVACAQELMEQMFAKQLEFDHIVVPSGSAGTHFDMPRASVKVFDDYVGPGYSLPTDAMVEAVTMLARTESILLDPVYSGKAMSGLMDLTRKGYFPEGAKVLFLHTGGSPALFAYEDTFRKAWKD